MNPYLSTLGPTIEHLVVNSPQIGPDYPGHPAGQWRSECPICAMVTTDAPWKTDPETGGLDWIALFVEDIALNIITAMDTKDPTLTREEVLSATCATAIAVLEHPDTPAFREMLLTRNRRLNERVEDT